MEEEKQSACLGLRTKRGLSSDEDEVDGEGVQLERKRRRGDETKIIDAEELKHIPEVHVRVEKDLPPIIEREARPERRHDCVNTRPAHLKSKTGEHGVSVKLIANYFEVLRKTSSSFRLHRVDFDPPLENSKVMKGLLRTKEQEIGPYVFDGTMLFTTTALSSDLLKIQDVGFENATEKYSLSIAFVRVVEPWEHLVFQLYNMIMRKAQHLVGFDLLGQHYFDRRASVAIPQYKLELWPGFIAAMRQQEEKVMLKVDLTFKALRTEDIFQQMRAIRNQYPDNFQQQCELEIVGSIVMTRYNRRTYKISGIEWNKSPVSTFPTRGKKGEKELQEVSFKEYFSRRHSAEISFDKQPMLIAVPKKKEVRRDGDSVEILLVPELCFRTGLTQDMRENFQLMKQLANHLHQPPVERLRRIEGFVRRLTGSDEVKTEMERWGIKLKPQPVHLEGRKIFGEPIIFQGGQEFKPTEKGDWGFAFKQNQMLECSLLENWVVIYPQRNNASIDNYIGTLIRCGSKMGYRIGQPARLDVREVNTRGYLAAIETAMAQMSSKKVVPHLIMIVLANNKGDTYAAIKKACSVGYGVPSQCILVKNVTSQRVMPICEKMLIQMNAKQGGRPWTVNNPMKDLMVVGFDMYSGGGSSIGAMVATTSDCMTQHYSTVIKIDNSNLTYGSSLEPPMSRCLKAYAARNGRLPARIMIYRDGVGEGQLSVVAKTEIESLKTILKSAYKQNDLPKFTFIIVTKRVSTRLFGFLGNEIVNPSPGTVVDSVITCPERYDFYMIPQSVRQGSVSPVCFNVIKDTSGLAPDKIQRFTFKLCHLYFNWSGTIPVPAVCQYARKLAFLTGTSLNSEAHPRLQTKLHYL